MCMWYMCVCVVCVHTFVCVWSRETKSEVGGRCRGRQSCGNRKWLCGQALGSLPQEPVAPVLVFVPQGRGECVWGGRFQDQSSEPFLFTLSPRWFLAQEEGSVEKVSRCSVCPSGGGWRPTGGEILRRDLPSPLPWRGRLYQGGPGQPRRPARSTGPGLRLPAPGCSESREAPSQTTPRCWWSRLCAGLTVDVPLSLGGVAPFPHPHFLLIRDIPGAC